MATTLNNIDEDLLFYHELKQYIWPVINKDIDNHNVWMVENGLLQIESLLELAISKVGNLQIEHKHGQDFIDGSDAKKVTSSFRNNRVKWGDWINSYQVSNVKNKNGKLRVMAWNRYANKFEYFVIPHQSFQHITGPYIEIILDRFSGHYTPPTPIGGSVFCKWNQYKVDTFYDLSTQ